MNRSCAFASAITTFAAACALTIGCSSEPSSPDSKADGGTGGTGSAGKPSNLPNLSTAGMGSTAGAGGNAQLPEVCRFAELSPCVSSALDEAVECLNAGRVGVFSSDRGSCGFDAAEGIADFAEPILPNRTIQFIRFDLRVGDRTCLHFAKEDADEPYVERYTLTTESHEVDYLHGFERRLSCDGTAYDYKGTDLSECPPSSKLELPMPLITNDAQGLAFEFQRLGRISRVFLCK
jgi:hypothetical protein